ncbi:MAG: signal peptidase II [Planctomycetota bacterium]|nr:MAG: signal peptidase II [Planctomycetota bacterium]
MNKIPKKHHILFWCLALGGSIFDLWTKAAIFKKVGPPGSDPISLVNHILELRTSHNTGALWGMGHNLPYSSLIFAGLSVVAAILIIWWLFPQGAAKDFWLTVALGLIMAGAMGNCYDRLMFGHVRDFMHFHIDPIGFDCAIFNFADNMLVAGAVILMILALKPPLEDPSVDSPVNPAAPVLD